MRVRLAKLAYFLFFLPILAEGQEITVLQPEKITSLWNGEFMPVAVSPDGKNILLTRPGFNELHLLNIGTDRMVQISSSRGAGYEPSFSTSGERIFYREDEYRDLRKYSALYEHDTKSGKSLLIEAPVRNLTPPSVVNDILYYSSDGNPRSRTVGRKSGIDNNNSVRLTLEELTPVLYINGARKEIRPNGQGNYIWASLSPDGTKILYNFNGICTYICDTEGRIISVPGRINAPKWLGNRYIIGMNDRDDGHRVISSDIVCYSLTSGKTTSLTDSGDVIEMYPVPFPDNRRIAYQGGRGEVYIVEILVK